MAKRILVVPDVHGRLFWKEPVKKYFDAVDRVVFLGDYLDPYEGEEGLADDIYENMMEIIELKRNNREKVEEVEWTNSIGTNIMKCSVITGHYFSSPIWKL